MARYPLHEYHAGTHPVIMLGHANGFPPAVYTPLVNALEMPNRVVSLPSRPLWGDANPAELKSWHMLAEDFLAGIERHQLGPVIGIGHSMSGAALLIAAVQQPQAFRGVILIDPVMLPRPLLRLRRVMERLHLYRDGKLVQGALKRRRTWPSVEEAYQQFRQRSLFKRTSDEVVRLYAESMTKPTSNGIELVYSPEWEAQIYRTIVLDIWRYPPKIKVPCLIIAGAESDTFLPPAAALWRKLRPDIALVTLPDLGHLLPLEAPAEVAMHIRKFVSELPA